jgi:L-lysine exporter family protein LysE/ArgO
MFDAFSQTSFLTGITLGGSLIIAIGAQNTYVLRQGLRREHVGAVVFVCALIDVLLMSAGVAGLGAAVTERPRLLDALAIGGACVLAAYAVAAFRRAWRPQALQAVAGGGAQPVGLVLSQVLGISLLNPHVYLDTVVLVGAVGARQAAGTQGAFLIGAGLASCLWFAGLGFGARGLAPLFARPVAWRVLDLGVGLTMSWIASRLAFGVFGR